MAKISKVQAANIERFKRRSARMLAEAKARAQYYEKYKERMRLAMQAIRQDPDPSP